MIEKSINLSRYFEIIKPQYVYLNILPHKSIRNYDTSGIAKAISDTYRSISRAIRIEQKKLFFETSFKISYIVDMNKDNASFYFLVPKCFINQIKEKCLAVWNRATITEMQSIKDYDIKNSVIYQLSYKKEDALSIQADKRSNQPLSQVLSVMNTMEDEDRVIIAYNFMPRSQGGWIKRYESTMEKIKRKEPILKSVLSAEYIFKQSVNVLATILSCFGQVLGDLFAVSSNNDKESLYSAILGVLDEQKSLSEYTKKKKDCDVVNTQIAIISESNNDIRRDTNVRNACRSYRVLDGDNELVSSKLSNRRARTVNLENVDIGTEIMCTSTDEMQNFIQLPARSLLKEFKISHIEVLEQDVPNELTSGVMCIGERTYKGNKTKCYISTDRNYRNLTLVVIGPTRAGKTNLLAHLCIDAIANGETCIIPDFCGQCELSSEIASHFKDKVLTIDCSDKDNLQALDYNDIKPKSDNVFDVYEASKIKTTQLKALVNSINPDNPLEPRMERYLTAAALVTFVNSGTVKEVFRALQDHKKRIDIINAIPENQNENLEEYVLSLEELHEWSKPSKDNPSEIIGTKIASVQGILNRVNKLKDNTYIELMLKADPKNNIDLLGEIEKGQLICLKMPETMFSTEEEKDIYCTYWMTKIWGVLQLRHEKINEADRVKVNLIIDELYQVPKAQEFLRTKINQIAKKTCKPIISCHSLEQIKYIKPELKSANASYMLVTGCNKDNYNELKEELEPFELEDLLSLKPYHSLNYIKSNDGYARFITKLPPDLNINKSKAKD